jgi:hypothetical protein
LLILAATFEIIGTITVAINYYRTSSSAKGITQSFNPRFSVPFSERAKIIDLAEKLTSKWYLTAGLVAYVLGAIFGFLAGLAAMYHW